MSPDRSSPPWIVTSPDGRLNVLAVPDRLLRHPELEQRGITPCQPLKPGFVYRTDTQKDPVYVVKILDPNTEEIAIYQRLLREIDRPNNHTIPSELTATGHPLLIMPMLGDVGSIHSETWSPPVLMDIIFQMVEGIEFLHNSYIAHMDICPGNVLAGNLHHATVHKHVVAGRVYVIDFNTSRQFALGPGVQRAITLPGTQFPPPNGLQHFDPYSWDVHCIGRTLEWIVEDQYEGTTKQPPWVARRYIQWLIGNERGCTGVCHCRPTARTALRMLVILRWAIHAEDSFHWVVHSVLRLWRTRS